MMHNQMVRMEARELGRTKKAVRISRQGQYFWLPLKVVHLVKKDDKLYITLPEWLALKKGMI